MREQSIDFGFKRIGSNCLFDPVQKLKVCYTGTTY